MRFPGGHCSFVPDFNFGFCCKSHDDYYEMGGTEEQRKFVDRCLRDCISAKGHHLLAWVYYFGVRLFGWRFYNYKKNVAKDVEKS